MKSLMMAGALCVLATAAHAQYRPYQQRPSYNYQPPAYVQPHVNRQGEYIQGHRRSSPDGNRFNNWSSQGNSNPYTGRRGTRDPFDLD